MKMMKILITLLLLASAISCSTTPKQTFIEPKPYAFQKTQVQKARTVRVHKKDQALYAAYIDAFRKKLRFHNEQIDAYFKSFKKD